MIIETEGKGKCVIAEKDYEIGDIVISSRRRYVEPERTMYSLQWDFQTHIDLDEPARLTNHSCDPNLCVRRNEYDGYDFIAIKKIKRNSELTWDYETTEYVSISISECLCGEERCRKTVVGFEKRSKLIRMLYGDNIADYLK